MVSLTVLLPLDPPACVAAEVKVGACTMCAAIAAALLSSGSAARSMPSALGFLLLAASALRSGQAAAGEVMQQLQDLGSIDDGSGPAAGWTVCSSNRSVCAPATVPGEVHTDLLAAGMIPEPFAEFNELSLRWVALENWTFSRNFTVLPAVLSGSGATVSTLIFDGLDTFANVTLNGHTLGQAANAFVRWEFVLPSGLLRAGDRANHLQVSFTCAQCAGQALAYEFQCRCTSSEPIATVTAGGRSRASLRLTSAGTGDQVISRRASIVASASRL